MENVWTRYLSLIGIFCGLIVATQVHAVGGMMTIQQISNTQQLGKWVLTTPENKMYADHRGEYVQKIEPVVGGTYSLSVDAPRKAKTSIEVYRSNKEIIRSVEGTRLAFTVPEGEAVRVVITYRFSGTIVVESEPSGQPFLLQGSNTITYTGETPALFQNVPPLYYSVQYSHKEGCRSPRKQSRMLDPNESLTFYGVYQCEPALTIGDTEPEPEPEIEEPRKLSLSLTANQAEVLPDGTVHYTLTVRNVSRGTLNDLSVSVQFDPEQGNILRVRNGGSIQGNIVAWDISEIYAGRQWTTQFAMSVNDDLKMGEQIALNTRVSSPGLVEEGVTDKQLTTSVGVVLLPQTGWKVDVLLAALTLAAASILAFSIRRKQQVVPHTA